RIARLQAEDLNLKIIEPPFYIPEFELKMAWCPLLHQHPAHRWLRQLIIFVARQIVQDEQRELLSVDSPQKL
ncbi:MAG: LysR family transcriptional regulator, partial [Chitinophagaceae bacterium]